MSTKSKRRINRRYVIAEVIYHEPFRPIELNELIFTIRWEGYTEYSTERWETNNSLHTNRVVLTYMLSKENLRVLIEDDLPKDFFVLTPKKSPKK
jgi:hypothetical protein